MTLSKHAMEAAQEISMMGTMWYSVGELESVIQTAIDAAVKEEVAPLVEAMVRVAHYPISSEPVGAAYNLQNIADDAIKHARAKGWL